MTFVHSFWSKPLLNSKFGDYKTLLETILTDYTYSTACVKKFGHHIKLYTDNFGKKLLDFIPYDEIIVIDNLDEESIHFAAQIKFEALKHMNLDECLIDGDLFMRKQEAYERLLSLNVDFIYSLLEPNQYILSSNVQKQKYEFIRSILFKYRENFKYPFTLDRNIQCYVWPNTSLMLFHNQKLKDEYINQYMYFKNLLKNEDFKSTWPDIVIEQRHMFKLLETGYSSAAFIEDFPIPDSLAFCRDIGFVHLGHAKIITNDKVKNWLHELDPGLAEKCEKRLSSLL